MPYSTFCASPSCHLHGMQVRSDIDSVRMQAVVRADTGRLLQESEMRTHTFEMRGFSRVWFHTIDGSRFSLCEDCARVGRIDPVPDLYVAIWRGAGNYEALRGKKPQYVAMGRADYVAALDAVHRRGLSYEFSLTSGGEEYAGLKVMRLDQPSGLFVF